MKERSLEKWGYGNLSISVHEKTVGTERVWLRKWELVFWRGGDILHLASRVPDISSTVPLTRNLHIEKNLKKAGQSLNLEVRALKDKDAQVPCVAPSIGRTQWVHVAH